MNQQSASLNQSKLLSIIMPAYNVGRTIENTLNSILRQQLRDIEIIIVDDGSTDATLQICQRIAEEQKATTPIRIIRQDRQGVSVARNTALAAVTGRYWTNVDADDEVLDGGLQALLAAAERDGYPDIVYGGYSEISRLNEHKEHVYGNATLRGDRAALGVIDGANYDGYVTVWAKIFKTEFTANSGVAFNPMMNKHEDADFMWRLFAKLKSATIVDDTVYRYLQTNSYLCSGFKGEKEVKSLMTLYKTIMETLAQIASGEELQRERQKLDRHLALTVNHTIAQLYLSGYKQKLRALRLIVSEAKAVNFDFTAHFDGGLKKLISRMLRIGVLPTHLSLLVLSRIPKYRKKLVRQ